MKRTLAGLEHVFGLRLLRFKARYEQGVDEAAYRAVVSQCIRVLEGGGEELAAELEGEGDEARARAVRRLAATCSPNAALTGGELDFLGLDPDTASADVAALAMDGGGGGVVLVMQLRGGGVRARHAYSVTLPEEGGEGGEGGECGAEVLQRVLEEHYATVGGEGDVPSEVITQYKLEDTGTLSSMLKKVKKGAKVAFRGGTFKGRRAAFDVRMVELAVANAGAEAERLRGVSESSKEGADELQRLLGLEGPPQVSDACPEASGQCHRWVGLPSPVAAIDLEYSPDPVNPTPKL